MSKKSFFLVCLLGLSSFTFGQQENKSKFGYGINFGVGSSTLENNQLGILSGNILALKFNIDYSISKEDNTKIISGIEFIDFNSSFFNGMNQSKLKNEYLQIPLKLTHRISLNENDKLRLVTGIGAYANFLLRSNITSLSDKINTKSGGVNFGYNILLGMEYNLSQNSTLIFNSDIMNEISAIKRNGYEQKQTEIILFSIGFSTKF